MDSTSFSSTASSSSSFSSHRLRVFVRIRPLMTSEIDAGEQTLEYKVEQQPHDHCALHVNKYDTQRGGATFKLKPKAATTVKSTSKSTSTASTSKSSSSSSFRCSQLSGVILPHVNNLTTYSMILAPSIERVLLGETSCCFCYGHTGSGKTHTIVGYDEERGLYYQGIKHLLDAIANTELLLQIKFAELYQGKIYDLLDSQAECFIREDGDGNVHIRSSTQMDEKGNVRVQSLQSRSTRDIHEAVKIIHTALQARATGSSNIHQQSSRSHAILEFEIVSQQVISQRLHTRKLESELVPVGKARDGKFIDIQSRCYAQSQTNSKEWIHNPNAVPQSEHDELAALNERVAVAEAAIRSSREQERTFMTQARTISSAAGGTLVCVDLAGAEYASTTATGIARTAKEMKEAKEINLSLLALKECIRAIHSEGGGTHVKNADTDTTASTQPNPPSTSSLSSTSSSTSNGGFVPFRNSKLTLFLRGHLLGQSSTPSSVIMCANISVATSQAQATGNTLQYAHLVATAK